MTINGHVDMFTADGKMQPGWLASQTDMLACDWGITDRTAKREEVSGESDKAETQKVTVAGGVTGDLGALLQDVVGKVHKDSGVPSDVTGAVISGITDAIRALAPAAEQKAA